ncbi:MAG: ABC transporter ATP-binding protein [Candidatus Schekmanbacteria bacterium]|nr:MAG: ABC transporter ATP-binding protein [Candidatus Schekmanbacteria bacterium]
MEYAVETYDIVKNYRELKKYRDYLTAPFRKKIITALKGISVKVRKGELFGLLGPNGAGKTTFLKILSTVVLPTSGKALVAGFDVEKEGMKVRRSIGYAMGDERSSYWRLTGRQNLEFFAVLNNLEKREAKKKIEEVLELTGLSKDADRHFKDYSTGMKQKLAIARGLLTDPAVLFLDEPTRSLDPTAAKQLREFIKEEIVRKRGTTVILATHNLSEAETLCDRIAIIDKGKLKACGTIDEIRRIITKGNRYRVELFGDEEDLVSRLKSIKGIDNPSLKNGSENKVFFCDFYLSDDKLQIKEIVKEMLDRDLNVISFHPVSQSLEEIFSSITEEDKNE